MVRSFIVFSLFLFYLAYSNVDEEVYFILKTQHYNSAYFIDERSVGNISIISLGINLSGNFKVESFLLKDNQILARISGFPVKITDNFIYFYDTYSFFRYSIKDYKIKKQKRLDTDFF